MKLKTAAVFLLCVALLTACGTPAEQSEQPGSLDGLRSAMHPPVMATAYLGSLEEAPETGIIGYLQAEFPQWTAEYDFVAEISDQRIVGTFGEVYCIVPRDPESTVTVSRAFLSVDGTPVVDQVLYRSDAGDPILILEDGMDETLFRVEVTDSLGQGVIWYPMWGISEATPGVYPESSRIVDFGPVIEYDEYEGLLSEGWYVPGTPEMAGTLWICDVSWALELTDQAGAAYLYRLGDGGEYLPTHAGSWTMADDLLVLELAPMADGGSRIDAGFPILMSPYEEPYLWFGRNSDGTSIPYMTEDVDGVWLHQAMG